MEFCPSSLKVEQKNKIQFTENEVRKILRDVGRGLNYLHQHNIVHLDIKPGFLILELSLLNTNRKHTH